jgi:aminoglycoside 6'-N-acetyltransferase
MPNDLHEISFEAVSPAHYELLREWLARPHMQEWWGDPDEEFGFIVDMVEGRDTTRPYVIVCDGEAVGYIQYWHIGHHQNDQWVRDNPWLTALPPETVGVDVSIGDPERLSKGIGSAALSAFTRMLREQGFETIIIDPDPNNRRAVRAYEKAGYRPIPHLLGRTEGVLLMQYGPNPNEKSI